MFSHTLTHLRTDYHVMKKITSCFFLQWVFFLFIEIEDEDFVVVVFSLLDICAIKPDDE